MTSRLTSETLLARDEIVASPEPRACDDQTFELPAGLYVAMGLMFAGFIVVLSLSFRDQMAVSYGIVFAFLAAFFAVPVIFMRAKPRSSRSALSWLEFLGRGIAWGEYRRRYLAGLRRPEAQAALAEARALIARGRVTLLCGCADARRCHRTLLADVLTRRAG